MTFCYLGYCTGIWSDLSFSDLNDFTVLFFNSLLPVVGFFFFFFSCRSLGRVEEYFEGHGLVCISFGDLDRVEGFRDGHAPTRLFRFGA